MKTFTSVNSGATGTQASDIGSRALANRTRMQGNAKNVPSCGCFGSPRNRKDLPDRPQSAPGAQRNSKASAVEDDESWRIGSQVPEPVEVQPSTAEVPSSTSSTPRYNPSSPKTASLRQVSLNMLTNVLHKAEQHKTISQQFFCFTGAKLHNMPPNIKLSGSSGYCWNLEVHSH